MKLPIFAECVGDVFFYSLARFALLEALNSIVIQPGDAVLIPEFICRELIASIHLAGALPIFYPVDDELNPKYLPTDHRVKAVLAINYFGFAQDLRLFREYCQSHKVILIEDNAHGFLSRDSFGKLLGRRGDIGILSIRKTFSLLDGGALLFNNQDIVYNLPKKVDFRNDSLPLRYTLKCLVRSIKNKCGIDLKTQSEQAVRFARKLFTGNEFPLAEDDCEVVIAGSRPMHQASVEELCKQDFIMEVKRRRELYKFFSEKLINENIKPVFPFLPVGTAPYGYAFRADMRMGEKIALIAKKMGFTCPVWPELPSSVLSSAPVHYRNVYWVNFLC